MATKTLNKNYINLHVHSIGSLRDGIMKVQDHVAHALKHEKGFVPITDHGSISEWILLYEECRKASLKPIYGMEAYIVLKREKFLEEKKGKPSHVTLLALNEVGYYNIIKFHNDAYQHFYRRQIGSYDFLWEHNEGIVVLSGCANGMLGRYVRDKDIAGADEYIQKMKDVFGDRFFIELMMIDHEEQPDLNRGYIQYAKKHKVPIVVTSDAHYVTPEDAKTHQLSLLLQSGQTVKDLESGKGWSFSAKDLWMKTEKDLLKDWLRDYKDDKVFTRAIFNQAVQNTDLITSRIEDIELEHPPRIPKYSHGYKKLEEMVIEGFDKKCQQGIIPEDSIDLYIEQIKKEMKSIKDMELVDYFLLIKEIHDFCDENDIAVGPGRGSVSASLVTFLIGLTKLDPIRWKFIFERFLNPARKTRMKVFE